MIENDRVIVLHSAAEMRDFVLGPLISNPTNASKRVGDPTRFRQEFHESFLKGGVFGYLDEKVVVLDSISVETIGLSGC